MMLKRFSLMVFLLGAAAAGALARGLEFQSMDHQIEERTTYEVFAGKAPLLRGRLRIEFDLKLQPISRFGYLFRLGNALDPSHIWTLSVDRRNGRQLVVRLNDEGFRSPIYAEIPSEDLPNNRWTRVSVRLDAEADSVLLDIGPFSYGAAVEFGAKDFRPSLFFGISGHVVDIPSFAIRDLCISDGKRSFRFALDEKEGQRVHDASGRARGRVIHPIWLNYDCAHWKKAGTFTSNRPGGVFYNPATHEAALYTADGISRLNLENNRESGHRYASPCPVNILSGTCFYWDDALYAYELTDWEEGPGKASVARLDLETLRWQPLSSDRLDGPMHHHSAFMNPVTGEETFYGGFGDMFFNGDFFSLGADGHWHRHEADRQGDPLLNPRFYCSAGVDPEGRYAYLFGGLGNETGDEVVGRRYFYDLHRYDLATGECRHMWTIEWPYEPSVPARGLIVGEDCFYALCYPEFLTKSTMYLYRFSLRDGSVERLASGIEVNSDKVWCYSNLCYDPLLGKLVALCVDADKERRPTVDIYTLLFPPEAVREKGWNGMFPLLGVLAGVFLLAGISVLLWIRGRKKARRRQEHDRYILSRTDSSKRVYLAADRPNAIFLFGDFTVFDRNGNNVSGAFSQQLRSLLLLLIQYGEAGISAPRLTGILWPDKDAALGRNSRGVAFSNLRKALSGLDGIRLEYNDNRYRLCLDESFCLDYYNVRRMIAAQRNEEALGALSRGRFLKDTPNPLFDAFKSDVESLVVPFLSTQMQEHAARGLRMATVEIATMAFAYDPLDEQALRLSVASLTALDRRDDALVRFSVFQANWQKLNGEPCPIRLNDL